MRVATMKQAISLKLARRIAGLTLKQLAERSGVEISILSRLDTGKRKGASVDTVVRIATALNLDPDELLTVPGPLVRRKCPDCHFTWTEAA
jgi:transcriptional regulator with XRE-family HTH domain